MYDTYYPALSHSALFQNIEPENIQTVLQCFQPRRESYRKNAVVVCTGDACQCIGLLVKGSLVMVKDTIQGDRLVLGEFHAGDFFGELFVFSDLESWPYSLVAKTDATVVFFSPDRMKSLCVNNCAHHQELIRNMLSILSRHYMETEKRVSYLSMKKSRHKLIHYLLDQWDGTLDDNNDPVVECRLNRNDLAAYLGLVRPSLSRELCALRDEELIAFDKKNITLLNLPELKKQAGA